MSTPLFELEGTWEEVAAHASELAGRRVRLFVLSESLEQKSFRPRSGRSLLRHAGTWAGDDLQECLDAVVQCAVRSGLTPDNQCSSSTRIIAAS